MANKLKIKRGPASTIPTGELAEPLFTTDTYDLYIGTGSGNQRFQKYIASGTTSQYLRGDGSLATHDLDSLTDVIITSPSNGQILSYNGTNWVNNALSGYVTGGATAAGQVGVWNSTTNIVGYTTFTFDNATDKLSMTNAYVNNNLTVDGQLVIKSESGASAYTRGLKFPDDSYGGSGDTAGLRLHNAGGENLILELYVGNDSLDTINFAVAAGGSTYNDNVTINGNKIWNAGNLPSPLSSTGSITSGEIAIFSNSTTVYSDTALFWDNSLNRLGVGGNSPNAQVGVTTSSGVNAFGYRTSGALYYELTMSFDNTTYGHLIATGRSGSTSARDLTLLNNTTILALDENNNIGINTLSPVVSATSNSATGLDIYSSSNTVSAGLALHTISSGTTSSDGFRVLMRNDGSVFMINQETGGMIINAGTGNYEIITNAATSFKIDSSTNKVGINNPASIAEALTVNGSIQQSGVTSSMLKANASGKLIAATAGSDYQAPITLTTTGTSGAATFSSNTLNIPQYQAALTNPITGTGTSGYHAKFTESTTLGNGLIYDGGSRAIAIANSSVNSWAYPFYVIEGGTYGQFLGYQTNAAAVKLGVNAYFNGSNYIYTNTGYGAAILDVASDSTNAYFAFYGAPSGTAGTAATLSPKMTINNDASVNIHGGFLGINHGSTPSSLIDARNSGNAIATLKNTFGGTLSYSSIRLTTANSGGVGDSIGEIRGISQNVNNRDTALTFLVSYGSTGQTEAMRITKDRNLNIGDTSDTSYKLNVNGTLGVTGAATFSSSVTATQGKFSGSRPQGIFTENGTSGLYLRDATGSSYKSWSIGTNDIVVGFAITPSTAAGGTTFTTPSFLINESGNVGIGTSSPQAKLQVSSTADFGAILKVSDTGTESTGILALGDGNTSTLNVGIWRAAANSMSSYGNWLNLGGYDGILFSTGNTSIGSQTERMRITSGGYTKMSNNGSYVSSTSSSHEMNSSVGTWIAEMRNSSTAPYGLIIKYTGASPNVTGDSQFFWCTDATESKFIIWSNGNTVNRNNSYGGISDIKLKENIVDTTPKLDDLLKVKIRNYNLIGSEEKHIGVIAQELEDVFPSMVEEFKEKDSDEIIKSVKYSVFVPMLVKAIQEQQQQIEELKAKLI